MGSACMKHLVKIVICLGYIIVCANFSMQESTDISDKQPYDIYGELIDRKGRRFHFNNLSISGAVANIPFYEKPACETDNPELNQASLDLIDIYEIKPVAQGDGAGCMIQEVSTFNRRHYVELLVTRADSQRTQQTYLLEDTKKIFCHQVESSTVTKRQISFRAIQKITIHGYKARTLSSKCNHVNNRRSVQRMNQEHEVE